MPLYVFQVKNAEVSFMLPLQMKEVGTTKIRHAVVQYHLITLNILHILAGLLLKCVLNKIWLRQGNGQDCPFLQNTIYC